MKHHALAILVFSLATPSWAAEGTLTDSSGPVTYTAGPFAVSNPSVLLGSQAGLTEIPECAPPTQPCDDFTLTVDLPAAYVKKNPNDHIRFIFAWPSPVEDYDVFMYEGDTPVFAAINSPGPGAPESFALPVQAGKHVYTLRIVPGAVAGGSVTASVTLASVAPSKNVSKGGAVMQNFESPAMLSANSGEPTLSVNQTTGRVLFLSGTTTLRTTFDDSAKPASALWEDVSAPLTSRETFDPILTGDDATGRVFVAQFVVGEGQSLGSFTDDDGETWTPGLYGAEVRSGLDHQCMGVGPYPASFVLPHPLYANAVYYCAQDLVTAECSRSDDGGLTFGVGVPIFGLAQGSIHGHIKVAADGTAYVPARLSPQKAGMAVSEDGGLTWEVRSLPDSISTVSSRWDPSVGIGADGTVYFGYANLGDDRPRIAVSHDKGKTWENDTDVGAPLGVVNSVFAAVVAGDADRAAYAFIGSTTPGDSNAPSFHGDWHLYVSMTTDGGKTWKTSNATPDDPVQRGIGICSNGIVCSGATPRNLLDFMDAVVDKEGRLLVGYADGCVDDCASNKDAPNSNSARAAIARQVSGPRLYAEFDKPKAASVPVTHTPAASGKQGKGLFLGALAPFMLMFFAIAALRRRSIHQE
ncbi:MAG: sialidase family protein [Pseudomonadota bacterium]